MKEKFSCVLLVDDDDATNYIHQHVIDEANFTEHVVVTKNGKEALDFLKSDTKDDFKKPDIIFLDINMPVMNGWEFLEEYKELETELKNQIIIVMLSTSYNPADKINSEATGLVERYITKPLTLEALNELKIAYLAPKVKLR